MTKTIRLDCLTCGTYLVRLPMWEERFTTDESVTEEAILNSCEANEFILIETHLARHTTSLQPTKDLVKVIIESEEEDKWHDRR